MSSPEWCCHSSGRILDVARIWPIAKLGWGRIVETFQGDSFRASSLVQSSLSLVQVYYLNWSWSALLDAWRAMLGKRFEKKCESLMFCQHAKFKLCALKKVFESGDDQRKTNFRFVHVLESCQHFSLILLTFTRHLLATFLKHNLSAVSLSLTLPLCSSLTCCCKDNVCWENTEEVVEIAQLSALQLGGFSCF